MIEGQPDEDTLAEARSACQALAAVGVALEIEAFAAELRRRADADRPRRIAEFALAWACMAGDERAIVVFERTHVASAALALRKLAITPAIIDDVLGWMRFELFVRPPPPLISTYSGRGALASWVRAIAVHEALKRARRARRELPEDHLPELPVPEPALLAMRGAYSAQLTRALSDSFAGLTTEERNLLRQHLLDGLNIDVLAGLYNIHRATAARRIAAARARLVERVRESLARELALSKGGVDQVITLSNLDESLGHILRTTR
jgi:RNA polymerase sigma-70 factor, ECF subfamily